jgi:AbrB family looped-hinge helix DNA binding protein
MFRKPEFFGSTTVGERGQIVLPIELRKKMQINAGDKLIVVGMHIPEGSGTGHIMLFKAEFLNEIIEQMETGQKVIKEMLKENEDVNSE